MKKYDGGESVIGGTYMDLKTGQLLSFARTDDAILPGTPSVKYVRIPVGMVFVLGPLAGLAYIIFLPLAGIGSMVILTGYKIRSWTAPLIPKPVKAK
jgi:hypothetical protein